MVADDGQKGDTGVVQPPEHRQCAHDVREGRAAVVKEVAGVDDCVDTLPDGVGRDLPEGVEKVLTALGEVVLLVPEVGVSGVYHPRH